MRIRPTTIILAVLILTTTNQTTSAQQIIAQDTAAVQGRIVRFPPDCSIGHLWIQDEGIVNINSFFDKWFDSTEKGKWQFIGPAQGDIVVPPGKRLSLSIPNDKNVWKDLSPLQNLKPNDLYQLWICGQVGVTTNPIDTCMPHIAHLTGLKDLSLYRANISNNGLQYIKDFHSLEYLYLPRRIDDTTITFITRFKNLKGLYFSDTGQVNNDGLAPLQKLSNLEEITFDGPKKITSKSFRHLSKIPALKTLALSSKKFTDDGLIYLRDMPQLKTLMLPYANITDSGLQFFSNLHQLQNLSLFSTLVTDAGIHHLVPLKSLRRLKLSKWPTNKTVDLLTDKSMLYLALIPTIESLELHTDCLSDFSAPEIAKLPNLKFLKAQKSAINFDIDLPPKHLEELLAKEKPLTNTGFEHLTRIKSHEYLRTSSPYITDEGIGSLDKLTNLKTLMLICPKVTDKGLTKIANMKNLQKIQLTFFFGLDNPQKHSYVTISGLTCLNDMTNLKSLGLSGVIQDDSGLNLSNLKKLESLHITCKVTSKQLRNKRIHLKYQSLTDNDLAFLENLKNLRYLGLRGSDDVTDKGLMHLKGLTNLETLHMYQASLTDEGLACLKDMKNLNDLSIGGNFTEHGLKHLKELKSLEYLCLYTDYGIPNRAVRDLKNSLPFLSNFQVYPK